MSKFENPKTSQQHTATCQESRAAKVASTFLALCEYSYINLHVYSGKLTEDTKK